VKVASAVQRGQEMLRAWGDVATVQRRCEVITEVLRPVVATGWFQAGGAYRMSSDGRMVAFGASGLATSEAACVDRIEDLAGTFRLAGALAGRNAKNRLISRETLVRETPELPVSEVVQHVLRPERFRDQCTMKVFAGEEQLATVWLCQRHDRPVHQADLRPLRPLMDAIAEWMQRVERPSGLPSRPGEVVIEGGQVVFATDEGHRWMADGAVRSQVLATLRAASLGQNAPMGPVSVELMPLCGRGRSAWLVRLRRVELLRRSRWADLTPSQRRVVSFSLAGAQRAEVARHLSISSETVKSQLREVYRRTGTSNLLELGALLGPEPSRAMVRSAEARAPSSGAA